MAVTWVTFWLVLERVSVLVALVGIPYLVHERRKYLPKLVFDLSGSHRTEFEKDGLQFGRASFSGSLKNLSLEPNTVQRVYLVVWRTERRNSTRRFGHGGTTILDENRERVGPPLVLPPRSSKKVRIEVETALDGTEDATLWRATVPASPDAPHLRLPRYEYELALEDVAGNLFDQKGLPRSRKAIALRWTWNNAWERFKDGNPLPLVRHTVAIFIEDLRFAIKRVLRKIGL